MSTTAAKAISLLGFFSETEPELGLSELARRSGVDKATVHRMLNVLAAAGLVEQHGETRLYRLGAGILRLARIREATFPVSKIVEPALQGLTTSTGETAHASLISGHCLATIGICPSPKSARVNLEAGEALSLHGTASGFAFLAFAPAGFADEVLSAGLKRHTNHTETDPQKLIKRIEESRKNGFATADQTYEDEVYGIAAPLFGPDGHSTGAIAVATPCHRMTDELRALIVREVISAAVEVTRQLGGVLPAPFLATTGRQAA